MMFASFHSKGTTPSSNNKLNTVSINNFDECVHSVEYNFAFILERIRVRLENWFVIHCYLYTNNM